MSTVQTYKIIKNKIDFKKSRFFTHSFAHRSYMLIYTALNWD